MIVWRGRGGRKHKTLQELKESLKLFNFNAGHMWHLKVRTALITIWSKYGFYKIQ